MKIEPGSPRRRPKVVIIGGGFAGLQAARSLKRADVDVVLIDRRNFHLFQPLLYQVATGELSPTNIASPLRVILRRQRNAQVLLGEVNGIDVAAKRVLLTDSEVAYDYLIVAAGSTHHYFGNDHWAPLAPGLKTVENAVEIRRQILGAFEAAERSDDPAEIAEILTFVVVGAGPTGCEMAGTLAEIAQHAMKYDFRRIDPSKARVVLIESGAEPLDVYPAPLPQRARTDLQRLGVEIIDQTRVTDVMPTHVELTQKATGRRNTLATRTVVWAAGVKASPLAQIVCEAAHLEPARGGRVPVQPDCSVGQCPEMFVVGDMASFDHDEQGDLPGLAPVATQMGKHAAKSIRADLKNRPREAFDYFDKGSLAVIGRYRAVGTIGGWKIKGIIAWAIWLGVHLMYITLFRSRFFVLIQWGWTYLTYDRSARLISDGPSVEISTMETSTGWDQDPALPTTRSDDLPKREIQLSKPEMLPEADSRQRELRQNG